MATPKLPKFGPPMGSPPAQARSVKPAAAAALGGFGAGFGAKIGQKMGGNAGSSPIAAGVGQMMERRAARVAARPPRAAAPPAMPLGGQGPRARNPNYIPPVGRPQPQPMMNNGGKVKKPSGRKR